MKIFQKKITKYILFGIVIIFLLGLVLKSFLVGKIETTLSEILPQQIKLTYKDLSINTFGQSLIISEPNIQLTDSVGNTIKGAVTFDEIAIEDIGLIDYFLNDKISLNTVLLTAPNGFLHNSFQLKSIKNHSKSNNNKVVGSLNLKHFIIENANLKVLDDTADSLKLATTNFNLEVDGISISDISTEPTIIYNNYTVDTDSIFVNLGPYENLRIKQIEGTNTKTLLTEIDLRTKYEPEELRKHISTERDYYDLAIDTISIKDIEINLNSNQLKADMLALDIINPDLKVYRDKLVADDLTQKPMLSEMIRNIPLKFQIDSFNVKNAAVKYEERVHSYNTGGELFFTNSYIDIQNLTNTDIISPVKINIHSYFYGESTVTAEWSFDLYNPDDDFIFKAEIDDLDLNEINAFSTPNLNTSMSGEFDRLYYTISGNKRTSTIDLKVSYSDIKITVLDKTHRNRNKFYSSLANLVVSSNSKTRKSKYKEHQSLVTRDQTKSNINFIVENIKTALTKILI